MLEYYLKTINQLIKLIEVVVLTFFSGITHIGFESHVLGSFRWVLDSRSKVTTGIDLNQQRKSRYTTNNSERPLIPGLYLLIVNDYKTMVMPNDSLNLAHPIVVAQAKLQPKDQIRAILPFRLTAICRPRCAYLT